MRRNSINDGRAPDPRGREDGGDGGNGGCRSERRRVFLGVPDEDLVLARSRCVLRKEISTTEPFLSSQAVRATTARRSECYPYSFLCPPQSADEHRKPLSANHVTLTQGRFRKVSSCQCGYQRSGRFPFCPLAQGTHYGNPCLKTQLHVDSMWKAKMWIPTVCPTAAPMKDVLPLHPPKFAITYLWDRAVILRPLSPIIITIVIISPVILISESFIMIVMMIIIIMIISNSIIITIITVEPCSKDS